MKFLWFNLEYNKYNEILKSLNDEAKEISVDTHSTCNHRFFSSTNEVSLHTLVVNIKEKISNRNKEKFIDPESQNSYILKSIAKKFGFEFQREEKRNFVILYLKAEKQKYSNANVIQFI